MSDEQRVGEWRDRFVAGNGCPVRVSVHKRGFVSLTLGTDSRPQTATLDANEVEHLRDALTVALLHAEMNAAKEGAREAMP